MMIKKSFAIILAAVMMTALFSGCAVNNNSEPEEEYDELLYLEAEGQTYDIGTDLSFEPFVIAEGGESGGHIGEAATMPLVPQVVDAVKIPVVAAGGIADGRGLAAALMLGAVGVQMGTRFIAAKECGVPQHYKDLVLKASDTSTIVTGRRLGHTVRSLKTPYSRHYAQVEYTDISDEDLEALGVGSLRKAAIDGDEKGGCYLAGQIAGLVKEEQTAAEIVEDVVREAEEILRGADRWLTD